MIEGGELSNRILGWMAGVIAVLFTILSGLIALIWSDNKQKHQSSEADRRKLRADLTNLELSTVGSDTMTEIKEEWRREVERMRDDAKERDRVRREETIYNHTQSTRHLEKIEGMVVALHQRLDRVLETRE